MEQPLPSGSILNERYRIEEQIGAGGMGQVFRAYDETMGRPVAIKILPESLARDPDRVRRFANEARAVSALNHPNVLTIHEVASSGGHQFMVTELLQGETLRSWLARARREPRKEIDLMIQLATGVAKAHSAGIIHRDLKPENVMITTDGVVKILDFGLAKMTDEITDADAATAVQKNETAAGVVLGTTSYLSPEQAESRRVDHRSDIFSLGVVLYEMVARRRPFEGSSAVDTAHRIIHSEPSPLIDFDPTAPFELQRIIRKCLAKNPDDRYQSVSELAVDLRALSREFDSLPRSGPIVPAAASRSRSVVAAILSLVVAIAIGAVVFHNTTRNRGEFSVQRLTSSGDVSAAAISPDGRYVACVHTARGRSSLSVLQVATRSEATIAGPGNVAYRHVQFSRDGNYIWFSRREGSGEYFLYRIPSLGGAESKRLSRAIFGGAFSLSPDETAVAFFERRTPGNDRLMVARFDVSSPRVIATRAAPARLLFDAPAWSPDGGKLAFCASTFEPSWQTMLFVHDLASGREDRLATREWSGLWGGSVVWTSDGRDIVLTAADRDTHPSQVWVVDAAKGSARRVTHDIDAYGDPSLTSDGTTLLASQTQFESNLWIVPVDSSDPPRQLTHDASISNGRWGLDWTPRGEILYSSVREDSAGIWSATPDGTKSRIVVDDALTSVCPAVSPDGRRLAVTSSRSGRYMLWTSNADGSGAEMIAGARRGVRPSWSPDGRWIVYTSDGDDVWRADAHDHRALPVRLSKGQCWNPTFTPDGQSIICYAPDFSSGAKGTVILPFAGGDAVATDVPASAARAGSGTFRFTSHGQLVYRVVREGVPNLWIRSLTDVASARQITSFDSGGIEDFDVSPADDEVVVARSTTRRDVVLVRNFR